MFVYQIFTYYIPRVASSSSLEMSAHARRRGKQSPMVRPQRAMAVPLHARRMLQIKLIEF
jgi:hypothetical protein